MFDGLGAHQTARHTTGFQGLTQGAPIHPAGVHRSGLDATVNEPIRHGVQLGGIGPTGAPQLVVVAVRHAGQDRMRAHSQPSGVEVDVAHPFGWAGFALG
jgi:hypothetical protein